MRQGGEPQGVQIVRQGEPTPYHCDFNPLYSPKIRLDGHDKLQSFTALGQITDDQAYPFQMSASFIPFRRNAAYAEIRRECPIAVIRTHPEWKKYAARLRYGHFEIGEDFFNFVRAYMLAQPEPPATNARQESLF